ncbi:hypothetical protein E2C06_22710 [Dankookia rubra]|uniref:HflX C-terminal domain-containing protein n=1 Tax=Dankookia rubra TaxID=1442381 RepID=A0A4R5QCJ9_9PROT|nr:hypothetical protein [Dankookia rubra]TDH60329.1 hypothetical protein E2C06_22710 [Dankookia rubra]
MNGTESHAGLHATSEAPMRTAVILPWQQDGQSRDAEARLAEAAELGGVARVGVCPGEVAASALTGEGLPALLSAVDTQRSEGLVTIGFDILTSDSAQFARLYGHDEVIGRHDGHAAIHVTLRLAPKDRACFERRRDAAPGR